MNTMRIKKRPVTAATQEAANYKEAISYIQSAIEALGMESGKDEAAREAIANLSVILLDLKTAK